MALPLSNTFETGLADETDVTTGNSGDGSAGNAFDTIDLGSGTIKYDTDRFAHGARGCRFNPSTGRINVKWAVASVGTITEAYGRMYLYRTAVPAGDSLWAIRIESSSATVALIVVELTTSDLLVFDADFDSDAAGANLPENAWTRIEFHIIASTTAGEITARVYEGDTTTLLGEATLSGAGTNTGANFEAISFGNANDAPGDTNAFWIDDLVVNATGWPGPVAGAPTAPGGHRMLTLGAG